MIEDSESGPVRGRDRDRRRWLWALAVGWLPAMGIGFTMSALADRLVFVGWALAAALVYTWALRHGFEVGSPATFGLLGAAVSLLGLAGLVSRHGESLDSGFRAFLPHLYHPWISHPGTLLGLGIVCGLGAALFKKQPKWRTSR